MAPTLNCPICAGASKVKRVGVLTVRDCMSCGHGWLEDLAADNDHSESAHYSEWRTANVNVMRVRAEKYVNQLEGLYGRLPVSVAEVGCSTGETQGLFAERGVESWGVDMAAPAIAQASATFPKCNFAVAMLPEPREPVEATMMMHVIEHISDPVAVLRELHEITADGGVLYLRLPNYGGAAARVFRGAWPDYMADHVHNFNRRSLTLTLEQAGWRMEKVRTSAEAWAWLGGLKRLLKRQRPQAGSLAASPPGPRAMKVLAAANRFGRPFFWLEERAGRGNELVVLAKKA